MDAAILEVKNVTGGYQMNQPVIHDLQFNVNQGEIVGLIGLNGAGKSTTIKHILGLLQQKQGSIMINQQTLVEAPEAYRSACAYIPETPLLYDDLTLWEHLELTAMAYGMDKDTFEQRAGKLLKEFYMDDKGAWFPSRMSKGMRQKVMIMNAFLVHPSLYIIDEPFVGLDPVGIRSLLELMVTMKNDGAGILMSSHILGTAEKYCDRFIILHGGRIKAQGTLAEIQSQTGYHSMSLEDLFIEMIKEEKR
ncbi:MAG: ABC transporter ATP-binding protein [Bacilli bacterium]